MRSIAFKKKITKYIERIMQSRDVRNTSGLHYLLTMLSRIYGGVVTLRDRAYTQGVFKTCRLPCFVVSIGNITVGGTGKTPMTIYIAKRLRETGLRVVVISRGYKGKAEKTGGLVSDGQTLYMDPRTAGEEPYMMALQLERIPVIVGHNRFASGTLAVERFHPDIIILDDAFQHRRLDRDLDLILLDKSAPFGNTHLLPRGILRERLSGLTRADGIIFTRSDLAPDDDPSAMRLIQDLAPKAPVFQTKHKPVVRHLAAPLSQQVASNEDSGRSNGLQLFAGKKVVAFAGIAHNAYFKQTLSHLNATVSAFLEFPDHYCYSSADIKQIENVAHATSCDLIVTTEKDYVKIDSRLRLLSNLAVIGIDIDFDLDADRFNRFLENRLSGIKAAGPFAHFKTKGII